MKEIKKKFNGYTLAEVLVSVFIIILISGIFLMNYRGSADASRLNLAAQQAVSDIRLAQNNALGLAEYDGGLPIGGWGVRFAKNSNQYFVFADVDGGKDYDDEEALVTSGGKIVKLPEGVTVDSLKINSLESESIDFVYLPPSPKLYLNGVEAGGAEIVLKDNAGDKKKIIEVNFFGLVGLRQ
jgi:type II secretory pathway pseudopilin PulG